MLKLAFGILVVVVVGSCRVCVVVVVIVEERKGGKRRGFFIIIIIEVEDLETLLSLEGGAFGWLAQLQILL